MKNQPAPSRILATIACLISVAACFAYAYFRDGLPDWWRGYGGGIPYVVFWITFAFMLRPACRFVLRICVWAVLITCVLEVLQLWKPDWLMQIRATQFGAALLGSGFDWNDFLPYFIGGAVGYIVLFLICRTSPRSPSPIELGIKS